MDEKDNAFIPAEPENSAEPQQTENVDVIAEKYSAENTEKTEALENSVENIQQPYAATPPAAPAPQFQPQQQWQPVYNAQQPVYQAQPIAQPFQQQQPPIQKNGKKKGRMAFCIILAILLVVSVIAIPVALKGAFSVSDKSGHEQTTVNGDGPQLEINDTPVKDTPADGKELAPEAIYEKIAASNVAVMVYANQSLYTEGTGIVMGVDKTGTYTYIITCAHVISDAGIETVIQMEDGTRYDAEIVGYDARTDIGVLKIKATGLKAAEFGDSDSLKVGSTVYALGNPGGSALFGTFTDGKVSAIGRSITSSIGYDMVCIQHNAAISPGNSGGMLVNEYGQVIGINSAKIAATDYEGISFAIPITQAKDIIDNIIAHGYVPGRPKLGISYVANDSSAISSVYSMVVQFKNLPSGSLVIYSIDKNSSLNGTEAQKGDMIIAVNGKKLDKADVLLETIENSSVGDELTLTLYRITVSGGRYETEEFDVKVTLIEEKSSPTEEVTTSTLFGNEGGYNFGF